MQFWGGGGGTFLLCMNVEFKINLQKTLRYTGKVRSINTNEISKHGISFPPVHPLIHSTNTLQLIIYVLSKFFIICGREGCNGRKSFWYISVSWSEHLPTKRLVQVQSQETPTGTVYYNVFWDLWRIWYALHTSNNV